MIKKNVTLIITTISTIGLLLTTSAAASARAFGPRLSDLCVSVQDGRLDNGNRLNLWDCHGGRDQSWAFRDGSITVGSTSSPKCLAIYNGELRNGNTAVVWDCNGDNDKNWVFTSSGLIQNRFDRSKCISTYNGALRRDISLILWDCHGQSDQRWSFRSADTITPDVDFIVDGIQLNLTGLLSVNVRNIGSASGTFGSINCAITGRGTQVSTSRVTIRPGETRSVRITSLASVRGGTRVSCQVDGGQTTSTTDGRPLPEGIVFNNSLTSTVF